MNEVDPNDLPSELYDELYLPKEDCWKHHYSVLKVGGKRALEPLLKQAGIEIKHSNFDKEEDAIILRNWEGLKDELRFEEGEDARMFVGFGKKTRPAEVSDCAERARDCNFNQRICKGLQHRFLLPVRKRFEKLLDPKRLNLQRNETPYELAITPQNKAFLKKDGKLCKMNEDELNQVVTAMNNTEGMVDAALQLENTLGLQWTAEYILNQIYRLEKLEGSTLEREKWTKFYKSFVRKLMIAEKKSEMEIVKLFEDEEYDWKTKAPWLTVGLCDGISRTKTYLIRVWNELHEKIRKIIAKYRENGKPFVPFRLMELVNHEDGFDAWRVEQEREWGKKMEETEARQRYDNVLVQLENHLVGTQRKRNYGRPSGFHEICRFENGQLVLESGDLHELNQNRIRRAERRSLATPEEDIISDGDDGDDDEPLQDPIPLNINRFGEDIGKAAIPDTEGSKTEEGESANIEGERDELVSNAAVMDEIAEPIEDNEDVDDQMERKKKKKKRSIDSSENGQDDGVDSGENKRKRKNEKRRLSEGNEEGEAKEDIDKEVSTPKKKKKKETVEEEEVAETGMDVVEESEEREEEGDVNDQSSHKKKKKKKETVEKEEVAETGMDVMEEREDREEEADVNDQSSHKKKKKKKETVEKEEVAETGMDVMEEREDREEEAEVNDQSSHKKNKKKKETVEKEEVAETGMDVMEERGEREDREEEGDVNDQSSHKKKKKKKKKETVEKEEVAETGMDVMEEREDREEEAEVNDQSSHKKKKKKKKKERIEEEEVAETGMDVVEEREEEGDVNDQSSQKKTKKKKRRSSNGITE